MSLGFNGIQLEVLIDQIISKRNCKL